MADPNPTAQLQFGPDRCLYGQLLSIDSAEATLRPLVQQAAIPPMSRLTAARLFYFQGPRLISAPASVDTISGGDLKLSFTGAHSTIERRNCERVVCDLSVSYRSIRTSNTFSAWHAGVAHNISSGGLGLWIDTEPPASAMLDLHIFLPSVPMDQEMEALFSAVPVVEGSKRPAVGARAPQRAGPRGGSGLADDRLRAKLPPLRLQGQIRHIRRGEGSAIYVGIRFASVTPTVYWQLSQLVQTLTRMASG